VRSGRGGGRHQEAGSEEREWTKAGISEEAGRMSVSWLAYGAGALLRFLLATSTSFLENRPEISTPLNSWKRLQEGVSLSKLGRRPFRGRILIFAVQFIIEKRLLTWYKCCGTALVSMRIWIQGFDGQK
jgi:hypothetical protein